MHELAESASRNAIIDFMYSLLNVDFLGNKITAFQIFSEVSQTFAATIPKHLYPILSLVRLRKAKHVVAMRFLKKKGKVGRETQKYILCSCFGCMPISRDKGNVEVGGGIKPKTS